MTFEAAHYVEGEGMLHRLNPLSKLLVLLLVCVALFLFEGWSPAVGIVVFLALFYVPGPLGVRRLIAVLRTLPVFIAIIVLARVFLVDRALPLDARLAAGALQALRVVGLVIAVHLFVSVTDAVSIADSIAGALALLRRSGPRSGELSLMAMIISSFMPFMTAEVRRLQVAQAARCGFPRPGPSAVRAAVPLVSALVVGVLRRTDDLELALAARGYRLGAPRTPSRSVGMGRLDLAVCVGAVILFCAGLFFAFS